MVEELPRRGGPRKYLGPRPRLLRRDFQRNEAGAREIVDPRTKERARIQKRATHIFWWPLWPRVCKNSKFTVTYLVIF
jgi:hypothetical protein